MRWLRIFICGGLLLLLAGIVGFFSLPWLVISPLPTDAEQLPAADVMIHWIELSRSQTDEWVVQLYQQGKANKIICVSSRVSWDVYAADFTRQHLIALGVPAENVGTLRLEQEACVAPNIKRVAEFVKVQGWQRTLMITDPTAKTSQLIKYFQQQRLSLFLTCVPQDRDELMYQWWKSHWKLQWIMKSAIGVLLDSMYAECR
ncbi:MAG: hypothetical protein JNM09_14570 [Blastocatellia bacterium]|nr:hypothetical protein [Blastocatellia bacterium]